ncbi:MAG: DUF4276 family protein [Candidatus Kapabacteria bacterium]|nr:DUF4276 family protein [Candidatus Kapabacteria bacterium]
MKRLFIIVEGQTEEEFVKTILRNYLISKNIYVVHPIKIQTSKSQKGGFVNYEHLKNDVNRLLKSQSDIFVSTLVDFFKIPTNVPKYDQSMKLRTSNLKVEALERAMKDNISDDRFLPYIQLYEFEALLFSSNKGFNSFWSSEPRVIKDIENIIDKYPNPEDINDNPNTAPSKRLLDIIKDYNKIVYGNLIAQEIGIEAIIEKCPRFRNWVETLVTKLEEK